MGRFLLGFCFLLVSCSSVNHWVSGVRREEFLKTKLAKPSPEDFVAHFARLEQDFVTSINAQIIGLSGRDRAYLESMVGALLEKNRSIYTDKREAKFYIIRSSVPFYFSLPSGSYFYSTGIFKKYIKSEGFLRAIMAIETFRVYHRIYVRRILMPTDRINLEQMISLTRIPLDYRNEVNKWGHFTLRGAGMDPTSILNWIQIRNRNILDFSLMDGPLGVASREEFAFKNFLARTVKETVNIDTQGNSSREFHRLLDIIHRQDP